MDVRRSALALTVMIIAQWVLAGIDANAGDGFILVDDSIDVGGGNSAHGIGFDGFE